MTIGIDARFYGPKERGLGRYNQKLVKYLQEVDKKNKYKIFLTKKHWEDCRLTNSNFKKVLADFSWYSFQEQLFFPWLLYKEKLDLVHFPHFNVPLFYRRSYVITIHDLITHSFSTHRATTLSFFYYKLKRLGYHLIFHNAVKTASRIITISKFSQKELIKRYKGLEKKILVTYEGVEKESLCPVPLKTDSKREKRLLYVGAAYPHKNLENLLKSFKILTKENLNQGLNLRIVGHTRYFTPKLKKWARKNQLAENVIFTGAISDKRLNEEYGKATLFVFPSLMEGFGLPPLEAMARGVPVISSQTSAMPEILGPAAVYFNPCNPADMATKISEVLKDQKLKAVLISRGRQRVKKYSWREMAKKVQEIYESKSSGS